MEVRGPAVRSFGAGSAVLTVSPLDERPAVLGRLGAVRLRVIDVDADIRLARRALREPASGSGVGVSDVGVCRLAVGSFGAGKDRKSTRLNSSHANISYAVFCLKKK